MVSVHTDALNFDLENGKSSRIKTDQPAELKREEVHQNVFDPNLSKCRQFESKPNFGELFQPIFKFEEKRKLTKISLQT